MTEALLDIQNLEVTFTTQSGHLQALCGVNFAISAGEIFGLVGESGCGKSVTGLSILRMVPSPGRITGGTITFQGENLLAKREADMRRLRGAGIAVIFQDPTTSLNPVFSVGRQLVDVLRQHRSMDGQTAREEVLATMVSVGLPDVERIFRSYPHELSGGMQQRVMIAMALVCGPALLIADEPTTALDVTIQAQILRLLRELRDEKQITIMLITHDLGVIAEACDRVAVLYAGRVVEMGTTEAIFAAPQHPYTQGLINAIPRPRQRGQSLVAIPGIVPGNPGAVVGCAFASRCPYVFERCYETEPALIEVVPGHQSACYMAQEVVAGED
jgi:peptide/nickel transport system ATP-binding protein